MARDIAGAGVTMMRHDSLDQLLREAAAPPADPGPSRHAVRAALNLQLAQRMRREARMRAVRTAAIAATLLVWLVSPLGSDDFHITSETRHKADQDWTVYHQGLRGEEFWTRQPGREGAVDRGTAEEWLQQRAAGQGVLIGLTGWQLGNERHFLTHREFLIDGHYRSEGEGVSGQGDRIPPGLKSYLGPHPRAAINSFIEISSSRAPDFTVPMRFNDLDWIVSGWRIRLPGKEEIIYYKGLRADGVRTKDTEPW